LPYNARENDRVKEERRCIVESLLELLPFGVQWKRGAEEKERRYATSVQASDFAVFKVKLLVMGTSF
jgi:hypothetical protein